MNRQEFFKKLRHGMRRTFTEEEITDVLADYEGFFASGGAEGKNEAQICTELGDPADIARGLAIELEKTRINPLWVKIFVRMLLTVLAGFAGYLFGGYILWNTGFFHGNILLYAALMVMMWLLLAGFTWKLPAVAPMPQRLWTGLFITCHIFIGGLVIVDYAFSYYALSSHLQGQAVSAVASSYFLQFVPIVQFIPLLIAAISVYGFYRVSPQWFTVVSHAFGASVFMWTAANIVGRIDGPEDLQKMPVVLIVYGVSLIATALLAAFVRMESRRVK